MRAVTPQQYGRKGCDAGAVGTPGELEVRRSVRSELCTCLLDTGCPRAFLLASEVRSAKLVGDKTREDTTDLRAEVPHHTLEVSGGGVL